MGYLSIGHMCTWYGPSIWLLDKNMTTNTKQLHIIFCLLGRWPHQAFCIVKDNIIFPFLFSFLGIWGWEIRWAALINHWYILGLVVFFLQAINRAQRIIFFFKKKKIWAWRILGNESFTRKIKLWSQYQWLENLVS